MKVIGCAEYEPVGEAVVVRILAHPENTAVPRSNQPHDKARERQLPGHQQIIVAVAPPRARDQANRDQRGEKERRNCEVEHRPPSDQSSTPSVAMTERGAPTM